MLPVKNTYFSWEFKLKKFLEGFAGAPRYRHQLWLGSFASLGFHTLPALWGENEPLDAYVYGLKTYAVVIVKRNITFRY